MFISISLKKAFMPFLLFSFMIIFISAVIFSVYGKENENVNKEGIAVPILMYHNVVSGKSSTYCVSPEVFEKDLIYLKNKGYQSVKLSQLIDYVENGTLLPEKPVVITFDDGYLNNYINVLPLLEKYDMSAVVSVIGIYSEKFSLEKSDNLSYAHLTWQQIKELNDSGRFEIGNHTYDMHKQSGRNGCMRLSGESDEKYSEILTSDISKLQNMLNENCAITPYVFTYPYGYISKGSREIIKKIGFKASLGCDEKMNYINRGDIDCLYCLGRFNRPSNFDTETFMRKNKII